jgi:hypothetical protein
VYFVLPGGLGQKGFLLLSSGSSRSKSFFLLWSDFGLFSLILNLLHHVLELLVSVPLLEHVEETASVLLPSKNLLVLLVSSLLFLISLLFFH